MIWERAPDMNRSLALAVAASLALHGLLLVWAPQWEVDTAVEPSPIVATLESTSEALPGRAAPEPAPQSQPTPAPAPDTPPRSEPPQPKVEPKPRVAPRPERIAPKPRAESVHTPIEQAPAAPSDSSATAREPAPSGADVPEADQVIGALPQPSGPVVDGSAIDAYRAAIYAAARRYRDYPRYARSREWEGRAVVRLEIDARGRAQRITVATSSGYDVLDDSALEMVRKAQRNVPVPQALRGQAFSVDIAVVYELKD